MKKQAFGDVLQDGCSYKFRNIYRETPVSESLFKNVADQRPITLLKKDSNTGVFLGILRNF